MTVRSEKYRLVDCSAAAVAAVVVVVGALTLQITPCGLQCLSL